MATEISPAPAEPLTVAEERPDQLKRELKLFDAAALSVGIIGPVGAMALLGVGTAATLGQAAPLAFIFAIFGVALVAYGVIRLSRHIVHAGSVYALAGVTLGPRAGLVAGWALAGAYMSIGAGSAIEVGLFGGEFLRGIGITSSQEWVVIALVGVAVIGFLAFNEVKLVTRTLLTAEVLAVLLVVGLSVFILLRLLVGDAPGDQSLSFDFLSLPEGSSLDTVATASVFGFLAFAGFEGAAALGEETSQPKREIPRAIKIAVTVAASFYLLTIIGQTLGYGTDAAGVEAFANAASPYGDLAGAYVGSGLADLLNLAATVSLLGIALACLTAGSRVLYALARNAFGAHSVVARTSAKTGAPVFTLAVCLLVYLGAMIGQRSTGPTSSTRRSTPSRSARSRCSWRTCSRRSGRSASSSSPRGTSRRPGSSSCRSAASRCSATRSTRTRSGSSSRTTGSRSSCCSGCSSRSPSPCSRRRSPGACGRR